MAQPAPAPAPAVDWKSPEFRAKCLQDMEKILSQYPTPSAGMSAKDLENKIFEKATTKEEYVNYVKVGLAKVALANRAAQDAELAEASAAAVSKDEP